MRRLDPEAEKLLGSSVIQWGADVQSWRGGAAGGIDIPIIEGSVEADDTAGLVREKLTVTVPRDYAPDARLAPLAGYGQRLRVRARIGHPGGAETLVPLGWYRIELDQPIGASTYTVNGYDLMTLVQRARFIGPTSTRAVTEFDGTNEVTASGMLRRLMSHIVPVTIDAAVNPGPVLETRQDIEPIMFIRERIDAVQKVLDAWPAQLRLNADGTGRVTAVPDMDTATGFPVLTFTDGEAGTVVAAEPEHPDREGFNACVAIGTAYNDNRDIWAMRTVNTGPMTWSDDPAQAVYGNTPGYLESDLIKTTASADKAASAMLKRWITEQAPVWTITCAPDPRPELGDVVRVNVGERSIVGPIRYLNLPLVAGSMTVKVAEV